MFKAVSYDYVTTISIVFSDKSKELFHIYADGCDKTVVWNGSWKEWAKDIIKAAVAETNYIDKPWDFAKVISVDDDQKEDEHVLHIQTLYCDEHGEPQIESSKEIYL